MNIYNLTKEEMEDYFVELGSKKFHADQLFSWLYEKRISSILEITNIKKELLEQVSLQYSFSKLKLIQVEKDVDVCIEKIELLEYDYPYFKIKTSVSKGTYIRSIIRDIGEITGHLAYTKELQRVSIGNYNIDMSCNIEDISKNKILSFFDMFKNFDKTIIEDASDIKQILCGNTKTIENIKINNKYMALTDNKNNLLAIIEKNGTDKNNKYAFIDID